MSLTLSAVWVFGPGAALGQATGPTGYVQPTYTNADLFVNRSLGNVTPEKIARDSFPSVVMIVTADSNGQPLAFGSGFFVDGGAVVTNLHVIAGAASGHIKIIGQSGTYPIEGTLATDATADLALLKIGGVTCKYSKPGYAPILGPDGAVRWTPLARASAAIKAGGKIVVAMTDPSGLGRWVPDSEIGAAIRAGGRLATDPSCPPSLPFDPGGAPVIGDTVFAVGNPEGLEGTFSAGIVSGVRAFGSGKLLQITAPISPGSSGGPVLDAEGRVVGVAEATLRDGQNLNFAVPVEYVARLMRNARPTVAPLSAAAAPTSSDSAVAQAGPDLLSGVTAGQFLWSDEHYWGWNTEEYAYSFTVLNHLNAPVKDIDLLVIFFGTDGTPVDSARVQIAGPILPGAAKRVYGADGESVRALAEDALVKFRVLNFGVVH